MLVAGNDGLGFSLIGEDDDDGASIEDEYLKILKNPNNWERRVQNGKEVAVFYCFVRAKKVCFPSEKRHAVFDHTNIRLVDIEF